MNCPICHEVRMKEVEKDHVLIDVCPSCKGVWLDRGELEKITEGLHQEQSYYKGYYETADRYYRDHRDYPKKDYKSVYDSKYPKHGYPHKKKRKKSMLDILDDIL
jgi:uncharacterized protein